jgi:hypothetical protein
VRYLSTLLILLVCAVGCQGPISDWPHSKGGDDGDFSSPTQGPGAGATPPNTGLNPSNPVVTPVPGGTAGASAGTTAGTVGGGGTTAGTSGGLLGGLISADAGAGGFLGGIISIDAGSVTSPPMAGTGGGASPFQDAGIGTSLDASAPVDAGVPDAALPDAALPDAAIDGGCAQVSTSDAGMCPGYGCRTSVQQLRTAIDSEGACTSAQALAVACDGRVTNAALQCTQESAFSLNIGRSVNTCLKRDPQLAMLGNDCLECFVDEALCTLSRCFAACTVSNGATCQTCKHQQCSANLALCTGLPAP